MTLRSLIVSRPSTSVLAFALLVLGLTGCSAAVERGAVVADRSGPAVAGPGPAPAGSTRILIRFGQSAVPATLDDTATARQFATLLPLEIDLRDPMGQAKSGPLRQSLDVAGAERTTDPAVGEIGFWAPSNTLAVFYDDLGQTLPSPGWVRLGVTGPNVSVLGDAGQRVRVRFELVDGVAGLAGASR